MTPVLGIELECGSDGRVPRLRGLTGVRTLFVTRSTLLCLRGLLPVQAKVRGKQQVESSAVELSHRWNEH